MNTVLRSATSVLPFSQACNEALDLALARDERVVLLGEDISGRSDGTFKVTKGLSAKYGIERVRDTPIAEQAIVGAAIGLAMGGMIPVAEIMLMDFIGVAMDQICNHAAKLRYMSGGRTAVPLTIRTVTGSSGGMGSQHTQSLEAWLTHTPGLKVVMPSTSADAKGLLTSCIFDEDPCVFIESARLMFGHRSVVPQGPYSIPLGKADVKRKGGDATIISYGWMVHEGLAAADLLAVDGIEAEVIDLRSLVPLDLPTVLESAARTKHVVIAHAATRFCGYGAEIAATIGEQLHGKLAGPVVRLGARFTPNPATAVHEGTMYPDRHQIADAVRRARQP